MDGAIMIAARGARRYGWPMPHDNAIIDHTRKWISSVIIGHNLCPFARREFEAERIHYAVINSPDRMEQLEQIILECEALDDNPARETSLLIFPQGLAGFEDYLDALGIGNKLLEDLGYAGVYQLASFHPDYCFDGVPANDPSHYTNRSPYPMVHILREASVTRALQTFPHPENIPARNIEHTRGLGLAVMQNLLSECYE